MAEKVKAELNIDFKEPKLEGLNEEQVVAYIKEQGYAKITKELMKAFIETYHEDDKKWFKEQAYEMKKERTSTVVVDANNNPVKKLNKKHEVINKRKFVELEGGEEKRVFNFKKAKDAFCDRYGMKSLIPTKKKATTKKDIFDDWD